MWLGEEGGGIEQKRNKREKKVLDTDKSVVSARGVGGVYVGVNADGLGVVNTQYSVQVM